MMFDVCLFIHRTGLLLEASGVGTYGILYINSNTKYKTQSGNYTDKCVHTSIENVFLEVCICIYSGKVVLIIKRLYFSQNTKILLLSTGIFWSFLKSHGLRITL